MFLVTWPGQGAVSRLDKALCLGVRTIAFKTWVLLMCVSAHTDLVALCLRTAQDRMKAEGRRPRSTPCGMRGLLRLGRQLMADGVRADSISADQGTAAREAAVTSFRSGATWVLVATGTTSPPRAALTAAR